MDSQAYFIQYVNHPLESAAWYERLLGKAPVEASPGFALFILGGGAKLGLWKRQDVLPVAGNPCECAQAELCLPVASEAALHEAYGKWQQLGIHILQTPTALDFGLSCTAEAPDGHRLRLFYPTM